MYVRLKGQFLDIWYAAKWAAFLLIDEFDRPTFYFLKISKDGRGNGCIISNIIYL